MPPIWATRAAMLVSATEQRFSETRRSCEMNNKRLQILIAVLGIAGTISAGLIGSYLTSYLDHSLAPVKSVPLQSVFVKSENVSYITNIRNYPVILDEKGISVRDFVGITAFFYFTATGTGQVGIGDNGVVYYANNLTAYARLFLDLQPYRNVTLYLFNNLGRYTGLPAQYNINVYSVSISVPLVRVTNIELEAFLSCWRCSVTLTDVAVNGTLFY
jgi:hypothetical protein